MSLANYIHTVDNKCTWIIDSDLLSSESFCGNFCVLRRSCAPPPPSVCKWIHFRLLGWQINAWKFSFMSIFKKADKCFCVCIVKKQCHEIVDFRFFLWISFPQAPEYTIGPFQMFSKIRGDIRSSRCTTGVLDTGGKWKKSSTRKVLIIFWNTFV